MAWYNKYMIGHNFKIFAALLVSLLITVMVRSNFFLGNSPRLNIIFFSSVPKRLSSFFSNFQVEKITSTPTPQEIPPDMTGSLVHPTIISVQQQIPLSSPTQKPYQPPPLIQPTQTPLVIPTSAPAANCPTTSNQTYGTIQTQSDYVISGPPDQHPEVNLGLRSYTQVNEKPELVNYGGDTDPQALKINSLFADGRLPTIIYTYKVNTWDYSTNSRSQQTENAWPVSLIGLAAKPRESLVVPPSGREIGNGNELMVIYAEANRITFTNSRGDNWTDGYILHVEDICTDPNLIAAYRTADAAGRGSLPALPKGKVFGTAQSSEVKVAIRDSGQFMDPRSRKDWW